MTDWKQKPQSDLEAAICELKATLPGWYYMVCECQVSCDARIAPTTESPHVKLAEHGNPFDEGFEAVLEQPSTLAEALRAAMADALTALKEAGQC